MSNTPKLRFKKFSGDWESKKLGELGEFFKGSTLSKTHLSEDGKPCVLYGELYTKYGEIIKNVISKTDLYDSKLVLGQKNDVLIPSSGETAIDIATASCLQQDDVILGGDLNVFRSDKLNGIFASYQLNNSKRHEIAKLAQGASVVHVYNTQLSKLKLNVPSLEEQEKIASFFSLIDDKISLQGEKVEALKDYKKSMMQKIFSRELRFKDDDGRDYPEWEEKKLGDFTKLMQSGLSRKLSDKDIGIPVIRSNNLIDGKIDISDIKYWHSIDDQGVKLENYFLKKNDLLVNFINSLAQIGKCSIYTDELKRNTIFTTNIMRLNFGHDIDVNYIFNYFQLKKYNDYIQSITKPAVNQASFTTADFKRFKVDLPNIEEQIKIGKLFKMLDFKIAKEEEKLDSLNEYKKGLLQQMFV